jgi:hypothetical protein
VVTTFAGGVNATNGAFADAIGTQAGFYKPWGVTLDGSGNLIVADILNQRIRMVTPAGVVTTVAGGVQGTTGVFIDATGTRAGFNQPASVAIDSIGNVIVTDASSYRIRRVTPVGVVTTIAGSGAYSNADGIGTTASFRYPGGVSVDAASGNIIIADILNNMIRILTSPAGTNTNFRMACANTVAFNISAFV